MTCDSVPMMAPHVTSNMGFTTWAGSTASVRFSALVARSFFRRMSDSVADTMSSRSFMNFCFFLSSAVVPNNPAPRRPPLSPSRLLKVSVSTFSRAASSSLSEKGFSLMRSKILVKKAGSRSVPSFPIPRLFRMNESVVIRRSSLIDGLCRSVLSMMTEKARMKAVSADGKTSGFWLVNRSANFSMIRSIFWASPGNRKPDKKSRMASAKNMPVKSMEVA
mmetsp:Transcript_1720/g.4434  ORF Transcript_1720/g.4434 Transcript_1720/m.4434 type:complete len:220 (-) Transcript_1720:2007-2666(-)